MTLQENIFRFQSLSMDISCQGLLQAKNVSEHVMAFAKTLHSVIQGVYLGKGTRKALENIKCKGYEMKLITKEIRLSTPIYDELSENNMIVQAKFFDPCSQWTWYLLSLENDNNIAYGYVNGIEDEFGSFSIKELEEYRGPLFLGIERDIYFKPTPLV